MVDLELELLLLRRRQELLLQVLHVGLGPLVSLAGLAEQILAGLEFPREASLSAWRDLTSSRRAASASASTPPAAAPSISARSSIDSAFALSSSSLRPRITASFSSASPSTTSADASELAAARSASDSRASDSYSRLDSRSLSPAASSTFARRFASRASASCALPETPWHSCLELPDLGREVVQALLLLLHLLQGA